MAPSPASHDACLILFAKVPAPGRVKTRLSPPLSAEAASRLYAAFLYDVLAQARALEGYDLRLAIWPHEDWAAWVEAAGRDAPELAAEEVWAQEGADLSARLARATTRALEDGWSQVVVRNTDSPLLPVERLHGARELLAGDDVDCVLGPDRSGGYYLVGLDEPAPELFSAIRESANEEVFGRTIACARTLELRTAVLPEEQDIDSARDLEELVSVLAADAAARQSAPRTAKIVDEIA